MPFAILEYKMAAIHHYYGKMWLNILKYFTVKPIDLLKTTWIERPTCVKRPHSLFK